MGDSNNQLLNSTSNPNANSQIITLTSKTNAELTLQANAKLTTSQKHFLDKAKAINEIEKRPFCFKDFRLSKSNFRQKILELKPHIEKYIDGRPCFYKVKGIEIPGDSHSITLKHMGVDTTQLENLLLNCKNQPPCLHDIRFKVESDLHLLFLKKGLSQNKYNGSIIVNHISSPDPNLTIKLLVYPSHIQLIIGCSFKPILYNSSSIQELIFVLGRYIELLRLFVNDNFSLQPISKWVCVGYHWNKDGSLEIHDSNFHYCFEDISNMLMRIYSKTFPDGTTKLRIEQIKNPNTSLTDMVKESLEN